MDSLKEHTQLRLRDLWEQLDVILAKIRLEQQKLSEGND